METSTVIVILLFTFSLWQLCNCNKRTVLESPQITKWGDWGPWERCPSGEFVVGMRLKTERITYSITGDNTGLNGIQFFCAKPGERINGQKFIASSYGSWGTWGSPFPCPGQNGVVKGFQLKSEGPKGIFFGMIRADDTAANNLRIFCTTSKSPVEGDGNGWGSWTTPQHCFPNQGICGLRTQVEYSQGWRDDTALNNLQVECCDLPVPTPTTTTKTPLRIDDTQNFI